MFCDKCGAQITASEQFCHSCGHPVLPTGARPSAPPRQAPSRGRVASHASALGILWIVYSVIHLLPAAGVFTVGSVGWPFLEHSHGPFFLAPILTAIGGVMALTSILGIVGGIGVLNYQSWARICLLFLGFLSLFSIPFGTAIGIYTIWVLLPSESESEMARIAHSR